MNQIHIQHQLCKNSIRFPRTFTQSRPSCDSPRHPVIRSRYTAATIYFEAVDGLPGIQADGSLNNRVNRGVCLAWHEGNSY